MSSRACSITSMKYFNKWCFPKVAGWALLSVSLSINVLASTFSERISFGRSISWKQLLNIHESPRYWLSVDGHKYYGIKGRPPYCLDVNTIGAVFFVTDDGVDTIAHFILKSGEHVAIATNEKRLGLGIGHLPEHSFYDFVESASDSRVVIGSRKPTGSIERYEFDLRAKKFIMLLSSEGRESQKDGSELKGAEGNCAKLSRDHFRFRERESICRRRLVRS